MAKLQIVVVTLFPEMFRAITDSGISRRAVEQGLVEISLLNPRDFTSDKHQTVDDRPYGGGPGMVMRYEPLALAVAEAHKMFGVARSEVRVIYLSPQGQPLTRSGVDEIQSRASKLILIAGRYEGIDERFIDSEVDEEWSIGDYVLSGGELPAMVMIDAMIRRLPGALGDAQSVEQDSFEQGLLDCPHYTRPELVAGKEVPQVLLSGDHGRIALWREKQSLGRTWERRRDLIEKKMADGSLTENQKALLDEYLNELDGSSNEPPSG